MNYATNFAIVENGVVSNVLWGMVYNSDEWPNAIQVNDLAVQIGDSYENGKFYRNGEEVLSRAEEEADMREALSILGVKIDG